MASGTTVANLKMIFSSDTTGLEKGAKTAKQSIKDFDSTVQSATDGIAKMFGVDTAAVDKMTSSLRGLGNTLKNSANEGTASFGKMLSSINAVQAGIAGLGIAAAVASFKLLNEEATAFKNTVEGANIDMMTAAYVSTYTQTLHDLNKATGQATAEVGAQLERGFKGAWASIKSAVLNTFTGGSQSIVGSILQQIPASTVAGAAGEQAAKIADQIYKIQRKISDELVHQSDLDAQIAEYRRIATDATESMAERTAAAALATEKIKEKYASIIPLNNQLADLMEEQLSLASSSPDAIDAANQQRVKANSLVRQEQQELRSLNRTQNTLNAAVAKEAAERKAAADALAAEAKAIADSRAALAATDLTTSGDLTKLLPSSITGPESSIEIKVKPVLDETATLDLTNELVSLAQNMSMAIGGLVGDLVTGGDAWGNFKNAALSAFADMAISVGKLAMSTGAAVAGIKVALEHINPYVAIAAGAALIALGAAVKSGLSNAASGNYTASTASVATAGYSRSPQNGGYALREMTVEVTGKLVADGDQLTAVINNTNNRNSHTT